MARKRQLVLIKLEDPDDRLSAVVPLARAKDFKDLVARFNTAPDGSGPPKGATEFLYGPGMVVEVPAGQDEVRQALVTCLDQDTAWPVLRAMCRELGWKLQDMESGQMFG